jgi:spermidine synthase
MSDTPAEIKDHLEFFSHMRGDVLIFGLGIGMAAEAALKDPEVKSVRVVELDHDVIALTAPTLLAKYGEKLEVVQADAFTYHKKCKTKFDAVWHDIWPTICADNLPEMAKLKRSWARRAGWQGFWAKIECVRSSRGRW